MLDDIGMQAANDAEIVGHRAEARKQLADEEPRFAMLAELKRRAQQRLLACPAQIDGGHDLAMVAFKLGLVIERIDMRDAAGAEDEDQILGLGGDMTPLR